MCGALATSDAVGREDRAGEVEPLLDVDRIGGVLQRHAHLLGDRHEQVVEHLQHDRIGLGADRPGARERHHALQQQMVLGGDRGAPAVLDHDGLVRLDDDGGACDLVAGRKLVAGVDRGLVPGAAGEEFACGGRARAACRASSCGAFAELGAAADRLDRHRLDHQLLAAVDEAEARLVRLLEGGFHLGKRARLDHQRRVGAGVADVGAHDHLDLARPARPGPRPRPWRPCRAARPRA